MRKAFPKIVMIGAGNVATHMAQRFFAQQVPILQVYSRKKKNATALAKKINATATHQLSEIYPRADVYIIAVHDSAIEKVASELEYLSDKSRLFVHTSGATPSTVLKPYFKNYGVFYPLQTFSKERPIDYSNIPICIDAKYKRDQTLLKYLASVLSENIYEISDKERAILHVAAVFVNNFVNHLYQIGDTITQKENLSFEILKPLIQETMLKIQNHAPADMQTGPAIRGDENTIKKHLDYLEKYPQFAEIYKLISESINSGMN